MRPIFDQAWKTLNKIAFMLSPDLERLFDKECQVCCVFVRKHRIVQKNTPLVLTFYRLEAPIMEILYGAKNGVHVFGCNSEESELIWMKSGALCVHCWGLVLADFWRDPHSSDSL